MVAFRCDKVCDVVRYAPQRELRYGSSLQAGYSLLTGAMGMNVYTQHPNGFLIDVLLRLLVQEGVRVSAGS